MSSSGLVKTPLPLLTFSVIVVALSFVSPEETDVPARNEQKNLDAFLTTPDILRRHGYPAEIHKVTSEDGYISTLHRIPGGRGSDDSSTTVNDARKPIIFLQHCIMTTSAVWLFLGPENGLGFILADEGFDVWMGNSRGNVYSKEHVSLSPNETEFWDFTWSEMGYYDLPAQIDYVLRLTGERKLSYVGYSLGTTVFFAMAASRPEYNSKISTMHALAPVAYFGRMQSPFRTPTTFLAHSDWAKKIVGEKEFILNSAYWSRFWSRVCKNSTAQLQRLCSNAIFVISGNDHEQINTATYPVSIGNLLTGTSAKTLIHYSQLVQSGDFCLYDYGRHGNLDKYGNMKPPKYDLRLITAPVSLHYSKTDGVIDVEDVKRLAESLPNLKGMYPVPDENFNHMDYIVAKDIRTLLYNDLIKMLKREA